MPLFELQKCCIQIQITWCWFKSQTTVTFANNDACVLRQQQRPSNTCVEMEMEIKPRHCLKKKKFSDLKIHKKDRITVCFFAFIANGFEHKDMRIKRSCSCATVFWLHSPCRFWTRSLKLSCSWGFSQPGFPSSRFSEHMLVKSHSSGSHDSWERDEKKTLFTIHYGSNESCPRNGQTHRRESLELRCHLGQNQTSPHVHNIPRMPVTGHHGPAALFNNYWMKNIVFEGVDGSFVTRQGVLEKELLDGHYVHWPWPRLHTHKRH